MIITIMITIVTKSALVTFSPMFKCDGGSSDGALGKKYKGL